MAARWLCLWVDVSVAALLILELQSTSWQLAESVGSQAVDFTSLEDEHEWMLWRQTHKKSYASDIDELERYIVWRSNKVFIDHHNNYSNIFGFTMKMNQFGDLVSDCSSKVAISLKNNSIV